MYIDAKEAAILRSLPVLPFTHVLRPSAASVTQCKKDFRAGQPLALSYPRAQAWDVAAYARALAVAEEQLATSSNAEVRDLYLAILHERGVRNAIIGAIQRGDDERVTALGAALFGAPVLSVAAARSILDAHLATRTKQTSTRHEKRIDAEAFMRIARELLAHYDPHGRIRIQLSSRTRLRLTLNAARGTGTLRVPKTLRISRARARRVLAHEIEVHALRFLRGLDSPLALLAHGTADLKRTEEGLAILRSQRVRREAALPAGFWDSYAAALIHELGFHQAFDELLRAQKRLHPDTSPVAHKKRIWRMLFRNVYGISSPGRAGILLPRGDVYMQGVALLDGIDRETRRALFLGRVALKDLPRIKALLPESSVRPPTRGLVRKLTQNL